MGLNIGDILRAILLVVNALAILSEKRFLAKYGLAHVPLEANGASGSIDGGLDFGNDNTAAVSPASVRGQVRNVLSSVRLILRGPLIVLNLLVVTFCLIFG